ncbi:MAG: HAMP domain-containing histidine kinase [Rubrobacteraceae bacterium]|nr:HAMP domain-containing histidine kinase [Rubrobacteraceae bacterium]
MFGRIRLKLTLGYVAILALILTIFGAVVVLGFSRQLTYRQDQLLQREARSEQRGVPAGGEEGGTLRKRERVEGFAWARLTPDGEVTARSGNASSLGLPALGQFREAVRMERPLAATIETPAGDVRVVSMPVVRSGRVAGVVQVAQSRETIGNTVGKLVEVLVPIGIFSLVLATVGGLYMSGRAMRPVREAFERQRTFVADASHELKTPLTVIRVDAELASRVATDRKVLEPLEHLVSETERMKNLISDLLLLARLDAGKLEIAREPFDLSEVLHETAERFAPRALSAGIGLDVGDPGGLPAVGDRARTSQILAALVDNALRHTPPGGSIILGGAHCHGKAELSVADTGGGIPEEHLPHIFDRFYRPEGSRGGEGGGAGLGLAIARDLARAQGGELIAGNDAAGKGAIFRLRLPAARAGR